MESKELSLPVPLTTASAASSPTNVKEEGVNNSVSNHVSDYFKTFPRGFKFLPTDEDLVFYLSKKLRNEALPPNLIVELDLYQYDPEYLAATYMDYGEKQWYFFTPREKKYQNGTRPKRSAGNGYWKATGGDKLIEDDGLLIGYRKVLVFYNGRPKAGDKTNWIMHEFRVHEPPQKKKNSNNMRLDDWVLCRIYKKPDKLSKTKKSKEEGDEVEDEDEVEHVEAESTDIFIDASSLHVEDNGTNHANQSAKRQRGIEYAENQSCYAVQQLSTQELFSSDPLLLKEDRFVWENSENIMSPHLDPIPTNNNGADGEELHGTMLISVRNQIALQMSLLRQV